MKIIFIVVVENETNAFNETDKDSLMYVNI